MIESRRMRVYLHNECERIGSGYHIVQVLIGRKWVKLVKLIGYRREQWTKLGGGAYSLKIGKRRDIWATGRMTMAAWKLIEHNAIELPPRKRRKS